MNQDPDSGFTSSFQNLVTSLGVDDLSPQEIQNLFTSLDSFPLEQSLGSKSWMNETFGLTPQSTITPSVQTNSDVKTIPDNNHQDTQPTKIQIQANPDSSELLIIKQGDALATIHNKIDRRYLDITKYLSTHSQREAAKALGIPSSTLSKRWREVKLLG